MPNWVCFARIIDHNSSIIDSRLRLGHGAHDHTCTGTRRRSEFRVYAGWTSLTRLKAELRTRHHPRGGGPNLAGQGRKSGPASSDTTSLYLGAVLHES
jgi:hypothetical protein